MTEMPQEMGLTVSAVARRLGVAPATLRTWDRRYGLGPSEHAAGAHRRYSATDVARLEIMRRHVIAGVPLAAAARAAIEWDGSSAVDAAAPDARASRRPGGGSVVPIKGASAQARGLARAAQALDIDACARIVQEGLDRQGAVWTWNELLLPVLQGLGSRWEQTGRGVEIEHVLSAAIESTYSQFVMKATKTSPGCILLACTEAESHTLPLWAVAAGLAERGVNVKMLGRQTPLSATCEAMRRIGPAGVLLWSQSTASADLRYLTELPDLRPEPLVVIGGPGWPEMDITPARRVTSLTEAVSVLSRHAGSVT